MPAVSHHVYWDPTFAVSLVDETIGTLDLTPANGYVVEDVDLGVPSPRVASQARVNANGQVDQSLYHGERSVGLTVTFNGNKAPHPVLRDRLLAYMNPRLRPYLTLQEPRDLVVDQFGVSTPRRRRILLRAAGGTVPYNHHKFSTVSVSWVGPKGIIEAAVPKVYEFAPGAGVEAGRSYNLTFDRAYPPSSRRGTFPIQNDGSTWLDWRAVITGPIENPKLYLGTDVLDLSYAGGVNLLDGQTLVIERLGKRIMYDGDPTNSASDRLDYIASTWWDIPPGQSIVRLDGDSYSTATKAVLSYYEAWL